MTSAARRTPSENELRGRAEQWVQKLTRDAVFPQRKGQGLTLDEMCVLSSYAPLTPPSPRVRKMMQLLAWLESIAT